MCYNRAKWTFYIFEICGLVGAFSVFGRADTGKPVQILCYLLDFEAFLEFKGLI